MLNTFTKKQAKTLWILCSVVVLFGILLTGCKKEDEAIVGFKYDENGNPNLIHQLTNGYDECKAEGLSAIEFRSGVPNDNSLIKFGNSVDDEVYVTELDVITRIMSNFDQIFVEITEDEIGTYDSAVEFTLYPKDDCDIERLRIKRNIQENSYLVQSFSGQGAWGLVVDGKDACEDLFALCEEYGVEMVSFTPKKVETENPEIHLWDALVASDVEKINFGFGQTIGDQEIIEQIAEDLSSIVGAEITREEFLNSYPPNVSIKMEIIGTTPENTYSLYLKRNTDHDLYWIEKVVDKGGWDETTELKVIDGFEAFEDLWLFYSGCQDEYLNIVR